MNTKFSKAIYSIWHSRELLLVLIRREVATRHAGTVAGIFWPYLQPLFTIAAYYLVLDVVFAMRLGAEAPVRAVGAFLIVGSLPWMAFCDSISRGSNSLLDAGSILQKNALPMELFPIKAVLASAIIYGPLILIVALCYFPIHHGSIALFALIPLMIFQTILTIGLAYLFAIFSVALRDTLQFITFFLSVGIYLSPVLFPLDMFPSNWRWVLWLNPMTPFILGYQEILLKGQWPFLIHWAAAIGWIIAAFLALVPILHRSRDQLVDWL